MITSVMLTVKVDEINRQYDMELPANVPMKELLPQLLVALGNIEEALLLEANFVRLRFHEDNRALADEDTFESAGVWDGSIITIERIA